MGRRSEERTGAVLAMFSAAARRRAPRVSELGVALAERHQARHEEHEQQDDQLEGEELPRQRDARPDRDRSDWGDHKFHNLLWLSNGDVGHRVRDDRPRSTTRGLHGWHAQSDTAAAAARWQRGWRWH